MSAPHEFLKAVRLQIAKIVCRVSGFPPNIVQFAQQDQKATGCLASVTLAQWALESGYGSAMPPGSNNPFGIKAGAGQPYVESITQENINGQMITVIARFRKFPSIEAAFEDHSALLMNPHGPYAKALPFKNDAIKFIQTIAPVYATDPDYAKKLISIVKSNNLTQYDKVS